MFKVVKRLGNKALVVLVVFGMVIFPLISGAIASQSGIRPPIASLKSVTPEVSSALFANVLHLNRFKTLRKKYAFDQAHMVAHGMMLNGKSMNTVTIPIIDNTEKIVQ